MASDKSSSDRIVPNLSRRDLFRTVSLATGGAMLLGLPKFIGSWGGTAEAAVARTFSGVNIALELDGAPAGFIEAVQGGNAFADILVEAVGPDAIQRKRPGPVKFEDLVIEVRLDGDAKALMSWITETLTKGSTPRNGAVVYADINFTEVKRLEFFNAVLTEVALPAADASDGKKLAALTLRITPQTTRLAGSKGKKLSGIAAKSKRLLNSNFRFNVQGLEKACVRIGKVESIVAKRPVAGSAVGQDRLKQSAPGVLDCSIVRLTLPEADAGPFYTWFDDTVVKGRPGGELAGLLEWLDPTLKVVLASVQLAGLGIVRYAPEPINVGAERPGQVQVDMYCESFNITIL
ncbi:MAG: phage tail protein [Nitrospirota bacterium]|nr:phage tail protein [Nitrospirota bacterium]